MSAVESAQDDVPPKWTADRKTLMSLSFLGLLCVMVAIDATILVPALPSIADALHGTASETFWTGSSYLLSNATFQPLIATLSGTFGRRGMLFFSVVMFTIGSLISCLAQDFATLLAGRTVKGIGGGGIMALNLVIITDIVPLRQRPKYYAFTQISWGLGTVAGPLIGGAIAEYSNWRVLFYINFPFCAIGLATSPFVKEVGGRREQTINSMLMRVDWTGNLLFMAGTTSFLIGITWAGQQYDWNSYQVLVPLCIGVVVLCSSILWEMFAASAPFIRRTMLRSRPLMTTYVCTLIAGFLLYAHLYYVALFMMSVQSRTALMTGVSLLPIFIGFMPSSGLIGAAISRWGRWKWSLWLGWAINTLGAGLFILLDEGTAVVAWIFIFFSYGLGQGSLISAHNLAVQAIADVPDVAWASALFTFMRSVGLCLGVALGGTVLQSQLRVSLSDRGLPVGISNQFESFIFELVDMPSDDPTRIAIADAYAEAFTFLFQVLTGISAAALLLCFTITGEDTLNKGVIPTRILSGDSPSSNDMDAPQDLEGRGKEN
ncbi:MFS general substrate transporter [Hypoxylon crocopeplum]|nr:MFS general substrate transporter [Hypoxylon crocopeplum]